jgi:acetyl/propionyl-CoA carboxylase alpha subunit
LESDVPVSDLGDRILIHTSEGTFSGVAIRSGDAVLVSYRGQTFKFERTLRRAVDAAIGSGSLTAPMPGMIVEVLAAPGDHLARGSKIAVLEAMKTQLPLIMPFDGIVENVFVQAGQQVEQDAPIAQVHTETQQ